MKIISKRKDYYDYVAGYDTDPRKVFIRNEKIIDKNEPDHLIIDIIRKYTHHFSKHLNGIEFFIGCIWFCDQFSTYLFYEGKYYHDYNLIPKEIIQKIDKELNKNSRGWEKKSLKKFLHVRDKDYTYYIFSKEEEALDKEMNRIYGQPIIFSQYRVIPEIIVNGILKDIDFSQVKSPQEAYTELYNWIPYHEPKMPSDPTDMIRYEGKGFDKRTSFRNIK